MNAKDLTLRIPLGLLTIGVWLLVARDVVPFASAHAQDTAAAAPKKLELDELVVKKLRVVEDDGQDRVVIAGASHYPLPHIGGKDYPRSIAPAGMLFYRANGDECGGVVVLDSPQGTMNGLIFDYKNVDGISFGVNEIGEHYTASIEIAQRPPLETPIEKAFSVRPRRITLAASDGACEVALCDSHARERIQLIVAADGTPSLRMLDEDGEAIFEAP